MNLCKNISIVQSAKSWQEAIAIGAAPLLEEGSITQEYVDAMVENVIENGSYIVVAPDIAIPHARSERGALKTGISIMKLKTPVMFPEEKSVSLIICLSAQNNDEHMENLATLAEFFMDDDLVSKALNAQDIETIEEVFDGIQS